MYDEIDLQTAPSLMKGAPGQRAYSGKYNHFLQTAADYFECGRARLLTSTICRECPGPIAENFIKNDIVTDTPVDAGVCATRFGKKVAKE